MSTFTKLQNIVSVRNFLSISQTGCRRNFHVSCVNRLKEIRMEESEDGTINVKGVQVESPRKDFLLKLNGKGPPNTEACTDCPICRLGPSIHVSHTDVLILNQFVDSSGRMLDKKVTGLCRYQNKRMNYLIVMSRHAGLLPKRLPDGRIDPKESEGWRALNKYYNDDAVEDFFTTDRRKI